VSTLRLPDLSILVTADGHPNLVGMAELADRRYRALAHVSARVLNPEAVMSFRIEPDSPRSGTQKRVHIGLLKLGLRAAGFVNR
jgi:hypothetical protein